jgi:hypothetical protein
LRPSLSLTVAMTVAVVTLPPGLGSNRCGRAERSSYTIINVTLRDPQQDLLVIIP